MFLPLSLDDAAAWLERNEVTGVTGRDLLKLGAYGHLQIGLPLSCKAYSPSKYLNNAVSRMDAGNYSLDVKKAHDEAHVELLGVYVLPARTLFELEAKGKARTGQVYGLNGETFSVCVDVTLDELRITSQVLESFIKRIEKDSDAPAAKVDTDTSPSGDAPHALGSLEVFRSMKSLSGDELSITFMGGKPEHDKAGLGANNMLKISARNETRTVAVASLDLVNKQRGGVNGEGAILIGFMQGREPHKTASNATKISRLRNIFKKHLGITSSPFHDKALGWKPRFNIEDKRGAGEERNKREIERYKTVSFDEMNERGEKASDTNQTQQSSEDDYPFNEEDDAAADFMSGNNA